MTHARPTRRDVRRRRRALLSCLALALLGSACDSLVSKPSLYGSLQVRVTRRDSTPVPGAALQLYTGQRPMVYAATDAGGSFTFADVPEGVYGVRATPPPGYVGIESLIGGAESAVHDQIEMTGGTVARVSFRFLKEGTGSLGAIVRDASGAGVPQIPLTLYTPNGAFARATTDANGRAEFPGVPLGNYGMVAVRPAIYLDSAEAPLPHVDGFIVDAGSRDSATFQFARCAGSIDVSVRDSTGAGVPGAALFLYTATVLDTSTLGTTPSHVFGPLQCGQYGVRVSVPVGWTAREAPGVAYRDGLYVHRNAALATTLTVTKIGRGTISVKVTDDVGLQLEHVRVVLYTGSGVLQDVTTDAAGFATFSNLLVNSQYGVRVVPRAGYTVREASGSSFFDGVALTNGVTRSLLFVLKRD